MRHAKLFYILDREKQPVYCNNMTQYYGFFEKMNPVVASSYIGSSGIRVTTVFTGFDHALGAGKPQIFETCTYEKGLTIVDARYSTWEEAEKGHKNVMEWLTSKNPPKPSKQAS